MTSEEVINSRVELKTAARRLDEATSQQRLARKRLAMIADNIMQNISAGVALPAMRPRQNSGEF